MPHITSSPVVITQRRIPLDDSKEDLNNFFPHLPSYVHPTTGLLGIFPKAMVPYAQLMRIDKPAGLYGIYFPYLIGLFYAACITPEPPEPLLLGQLAIALLAFSIFLRGAACSWNDTLDQHFDRRVARCRHRPVARGAVSTWQAHIFTLALLGLGLYPVLIFLFPMECIPHAVIVVALAAVYAPMKRFTDYPQVVLGVACSWAVYFSAAALGIQPLFFGDEKCTATVALFAANVAWAITNDTFYAYQDVKDDERAGVRSMALKFKDSIKLLASMLALAQVSLLVLCGLWARFGAVYFFGLVGGVATAMSYYVLSVDLDQPESCGIWFHRQYWLVGAGYVAGLGGSYVMRLRFD
ncbi:putative 4-hydroxybenzoate polyprenyl transferase [Xylaria sp. FL1777]|nr:putative 4-hydroxybenzoate polyprenyl transferase [Xylaria sp. FL1777]